MLIEDLLYPDGRLQVPLKCLPTTQCLILEHCI